MHRTDSAATTNDSALQIARDAQAEHGTQQFGRIPATKTRSLPGDVAAPSTAATAVTIATDSTLCGAVHGPGAVGHLVAVLDPFPNIADEIVETEAVRLKTPDGRNLLEAIVWHGGEAKAARDKFVNFTKQQRNELLFFLESI